MNTAFWNTIHDGGIYAISGRVPGDIVLNVGIEYICKHLPTVAKTIQASLFGCTLFSYMPYGEAAITDLEAIAAYDIEILSAIARDDRIAICCLGGILEVAYDTVEVRLIEGTAVSQSELIAAADRAVTEWVERNAQK